MSEQAPQNFANHTRYDHKLTAALVMFLVAFIVGVVDIFVAANLAAVAVALLSAAAILLCMITRGYATSNQDRIIRLEMRLRLREVLPGDLASRVSEFTLSQLIGMRFASDGELPELARKVLDGELRTATEIKKLVKDWQPDHMRV